MSADPARDAALQQAAHDAWAFGNGFVMVTHHRDGSDTYEVISPERVQILDARPDTPQGEA